MTFQEYDMVTEIRTGVQWVVTGAVVGDRFEVVRRGELGRVYNLLRGDEIKVAR